MVDLSLSCCIMSLAVFLHKHYVIKMERSAGCPCMGVLA